MNRPVTTIAKYTFLEAVKNRLFLLVIISVVCIFGLGQFIAGLAVTESTEMKCAITGFTLRLLAVFIISLFVITSMVREFNDKTVDIIISHNLPRYIYFFGKLAGFFLLSIIVSLVLTLPLLFYSEYWQVVLWLTSMICELFIVVSLCLLFLFTLGNVTVALTAAAAFYLLSRTINTILLISNSPILDSENWSQEFMSTLINFIALVLPGLDQFTRTEWLVYGTGTINDFGFVLTQTVIYVILLSAAALFDLYRKNF